MKCLLDTNALSAMWRGDQPRLFEIIGSAEKVFISPVTVGELVAGFKKGQKSRENQFRLEEFLKSPRVNVTDISVVTSYRYAAIHDSLRRKGRPIPTNDVWIAASAMETGATVVTRDRHFQWIDQILVWQF